MTPIIIQDTVSVAAATTNENLLNSNTGAQRYIRPPMNVDCKLLLGVSSLAQPGLRLELVVNGECILDLSDARQVAAVAQLLQPDDIVVEQFFCPQGAQIVIRAVNGSAGAITCTYRIEMHESEGRQFPQRLTQRFQAIAANTTVSILTGLRYERPIVDSLLDIFASASATGVQLQLLVDGKSVAPAMPVGATNRMPLNPYDQVLNQIECPKDALIELIAQNTTGGALNFFWRTALQDLTEKAG